MSQMPEQIRDILGVVTFHLDQRDRRRIDSMSLQSRVDDSAPIVEENGSAQCIEPFQRAEFRRDP